MFKLKGTHIVENGPGASFWVKGSVTQPTIGNIYTQEENATLFDADQVLSIIERFNKRYKFELVNA